MEADISPRHLTIVECRPPWRQGTGPEWTRFPIARLRYTQATRTWTLYWRDRNLRFHLYDQLEPSPDIGSLLRETDRQPVAIFWDSPSRLRHSDSFKAPHIAWPRPQACLLLVVAPAPRDARGVRVVTAGDD